MPAYRQPLESGTPAVELGERRQHDLAPDPLEQRRGGRRHRRVGAHAAGVRAGVALAESLVVLRRRQEGHLLAVRQAEDGEFLSQEKRLDHDGASRVAEAALAEHGAHRVRRLAPGGAHDGALAGGEAGGLDHQRLGVGGHVGERGGELGEGAAGGGRNAGGLHHVLRERLRGLERRRAGGRAEHRTARSRRRSARPRASGTSGPMTVRSKACDTAASVRRAMSSDGMGRRVARLAMPGLPGAALSWTAGFSRWSAHARACSRPPPPTIRTFTRWSRASGRCGTPRRPCSRCCAPRRPPAARSPSLPWSSTPWRRASGRRAGAGRRGCRGGRTRRP